ncbi:MAG TPA: cytochrome d ubiquinol oxidase subunit II [Candidatus Nitrosotalea sp.]|nr:cytochrome d ubiquinol oxidase subunit II [Candidatus Nitrosotalea sp.]
MSAADAIAALLWLALTAYAVLAGADFGGGVMDLLASGPRAGAQRTAVAAAMGPVWEANHVWLIFLITGLFTAFPRAFGILGLALYLPFTIALLGIVLRGAAFAFRGHSPRELATPSRWGTLFGSASVIAPFFLGTAAAAVASGSIQVRRGQISSGFLAGWATPYGALIGAFAVSICAYLAATYLTVENQGRELEADFRRRALLAGLGSGVLGLAALALAPLAAPSLAHSLFGRGLPLLLLGLLNGPFALWAVFALRPRLARLAVVAQVVLVLWAWGLGQWPDLIPPELSLAAAAAPAATLTALLVVSGVGALILLPSLWLLFRVFKSPLIEDRG